MSYIFYSLSPLQRLLLHPCPAGHGGHPDLGPQHSQELPHGPHCRGLHRHLLGRQHAARQPRHRHLRPHHHQGLPHRPQRLGMYRWGHGLMSKAVINNITLTPFFRIYFCLQSIPVSLNVVRGFLSMLKIVMTV